MCIFYKIGLLNFAHVFRKFRGTEILKGTVYLLWQKEFHDPVSVRVNLTCENFSQKSVNLAQMRENGDRNSFEYRNFSRIVYLFSGNHCNILHKVRQPYKSKMQHTYKWRRFFVLYRRFPKLGQTGISWVPKLTLPVFLRTFPIEFSWCFDVGREIKIRKSNVYWLKSKLPLAQ